jgi:hypothetical protein
VGAANRTLKSLARADNNHFFAAGQWALRIVQA